MNKVKIFKNFIGRIGLLGFLLAHVSIQCLGEEAWPTNHGSNRGTAYSLFVATHPSSSLALIGGRRYDFDNNRFYGWIQQTSTSTGLGDSGFSAAGSTNRNINVTTSVPDPGSAYFDLSNSTKESMCASAVWDTVYSNWWVLCRSLNANNKYVIYLVKATTTGTITSYKTDLGGGTDNNYHAVPGRQESLLYDSGKLVVVGHRGQNLTGVDSVKYRPFIATFTVTGAPADPATTTWTSTVRDFSSDDSDAYKHKAIGVIKAGSNYFAIYTKITASQGNLRIAKYSTSLVKQTGSKLFTDITFNSPYNGTPIVAPTAIAHYTGNSTTIYGVGGIKSSSSGVWNGFVGAFSTTDGTWVTSCNSIGYMTFQIQPGNDTLTNDMVVSSDGYGSPVGAAYNGTNYKAYIARMDLSSSHCDFDTNFGTGGVYFHSEGFADTIYRAAAIDQSGQLINAGTQQVVDATGVIRPGGYYRTFSSTSSTAAIKYVTSCTMDPIPSSAEEGSTATVNATYTYSDGSTSSVGIDEMACSGLPGTRSGSTLTAGVGTVSGSCFAIGSNGAKCGDFSVTFTATTCQGSACPP